MADKQIEIKKIRLSNQMDALQKINRKLEELGNKWELPDPFVMKINLVLEEAFTNIVKHAYRDQQAHTILLAFEKHENRLIITFEDDGIAYDPTKASDPDISLDAKDREVGGLGIFLIRQMMDEVRYERRENTNILRMEKSY